jgi:hypothetical protein
MHIVRVGYTLKFVPRVLTQDPKHVSSDQSNSEDPIDQTVDAWSSSRQPRSSLTDSDRSSLPDIDQSEVFMAVHASVSLGLDFSHGKNFAKDVKTSFFRLFTPPRPLVTLLWLSLLVDHLSSYVKILSALHLNLSLVAYVAP